MPYSGVSDPSLPKNVLALSEGDRKQWVEIFNGVEAKDATLAEKAANGVLKKKGVEIEGEALTDPEQLLQMEKSYQWVDSWEYSERKFSQIQANYNPLGATGEKGCANCRWFVSPARCAVVAGEISPTGLSSMWSAVTPYEPEPLPVRIVKQTVLDQPGASLMDVAKAAIQRLKEMITAPPNDPPVQEGPIVFFKDAETNRLRWFARVSNCWVDRDHEIISTAAHKEYVEWADSTARYPELWLWHTKGTRWGSTDWLDFSDGFLHASGLVDEGYEDLAERLSKEEVGISHGFFGLQKDNVVTKYRSFEISVLPRNNAAVWTTDFNVVGRENEVAFTEAKKNWLLNTAKLTPDAVTQLEKDTETTATALKEAGLQFKEVEEVVVEGEKAASTADLAPLMASIQQLTVAVGDLATKTKEHNERLVKVEKSDDEKIAAVIAPKVTAPVGHVASAASTNVVAKEDDKVVKNKEWFDQTVLGPILGAAVPAQQ